VRGLSHKCSMRGSSFADILWSRGPPDSIAGSAIGGEDQLGYAERMFLCTPPIPRWLCPRPDIFETCMVLGPSGW